MAATVATTQRTCLSSCKNTAPWVIEYQLNESHIFCSVPLATDRRYCCCCGSQRYYSISLSFLFCSCFVSDCLPSLFSSKHIWITFCCPVAPAGCAIAQQQARHEYITCPNVVLIVNGMLPSISKEHVVVLGANRRRTADVGLCARNGIAHFLCSIQIQHLFAAGGLSNAQNDFVCVCYVKSTSIRNAIRAAPELIPSIGCSKAYNYKYNRSASE